MNVERTTFESDEAPAEDADFDAAMEAAAEKARNDPRFSTLFEPFDDASDAQADADIAAGRFVPHEEVAEWLKTWGTPDYKPMPREWLE